MDDRELESIEAPTDSFLETESFDLHLDLPFSGGGDNATGAVLLLMNGAGSKETFEVVRSARGRFAGRAATESGENGGSAVVFEAFEPLRASATN